MSEENKINIEIFKIIKNAMGHSSELDVMASSLVQLLTGSLDIKGCALFILNPERRELDTLTTFGLSMNYLNKGSISTDKSISTLYKHKPVVISDVTDTDQLQYPEDAEKEGIKAIVSLPIVFSGKIIGALRLYSHKPWVISENDLETLLLFADHVGMAMMYTRLLNAFKIVKDTILDVHDVWIDHA